MDFPLGIDMRTIVTALSEHPEWRLQLRQIVDEMPMWKWRAHIEKGNSVLIPDSVIAEGIAHSPEMAIWELANELRKM